MDTLEIVVICVCLYLLWCMCTRGKSTFFNFSGQPRSVLNEYFDRVVCVTIPKREQHMRDIMRKWNVDAKIHPAYMKDTMDKEQLIREGFITPGCKLNDGRICCHYSHMQVLKDFLDDPQAKNILVFEDDMGPMYKNANHLNKVLTPYLKNIPKGWNYLNLGTCWENCNFNRRTNTPYWQHSYRPLCRNAIAFSKEGASIVYNMCKPMVDKPGDNMIGNLISSKILRNAYNTPKQLFSQNRKVWGSNLDNNGDVAPPQCR